MAGNYPDAPSWRMALDRDGTIGIIINSVNTITQMTAAQMQALNDEADGGTAVTVGGVQTPNVMVGYIFPEKRDIDAYFIDVGSASPASKVEVSADTTTGLDGTWTTITLGQSNNPTIPNYRTGIVSVTSLAMKGIRATFGGNYTANVNSFHVYGEIAPNANVDRLELWHPTSDAKVAPAYFDWGNTPRSSTLDRQFRVKNLSSAMTANSIRVAMDVLTDANPSVPAQHTISFNGGAFSPQVNIGNLAPGAISSLLTLRRITPSNAVLGLWAFRLFAEAGSWS